MRVHRHMHSIIDKADAAVCIVPVPFTLRKVETREPLAACVYYGLHPSIHIPCRLYRMKYEFRKKKVSFFISSYEASQISISFNIKCFHRTSDTGRLKFTMKYLNRMINSNVETLLSKQL